MARFCQQLTAVFVVSCLVTLPVTAGATGTTAGANEPEPGIEAFLRGRYAQAQRTLDERARSAHAPSQYYLGLIYLRGHTGLSDQALAYAWFAAGEANGHRPSQVMRRRLHRQLAIGNLPRAERMARQYVYQFSGVKLTPAPCFRSGVNYAVVACD